MNANGNGRVVVGACATPAGYQAVRYAVAEARRRGQSLVVVRTYSCGNPGYAAMFRTALEEAAHEEIRQVFIAALGAMPDGVAMTEIVREGRPAAALAEAANRTGDLIVIGGSGPFRLGLRRGGTAAECSRRATCPVVIVPPPALSRAAPEGRLAHSAALEMEAYLVEHTKPGLAARG